MKVCSNKWSQPRPKGIITKLNRIMIDLPKPMKGKKDYPEYRKGQKSRHNNYKSCNKLRKRKKEYMRNWKINNTTKITKLNRIMIELPKPMKRKKDYPEYRKGQKSRHKITKPKTSRRRRRVNSRKKGIRNTIDREARKGVDMGERW